MTDQQLTSAKSAMTAPRLYLSFVAMMVALTGMTLAPQAASAHDYHKHRNGNVAIQFTFGNGVASTRKIIRPHRHKAVVHTCNPLKAKHIARKHYKLRHARIIRVNKSHIVISGRTRGKAKWITFGHYCKRLSR